MFLVQSTLEVVNFSSYSPYKSYDTMMASLLLFQQKFSFLIKSGTIDATY